ncbi:Lysine exporter protein [Bifidobacterium margollesii]|uniref:Lysine exporter protein n=1 Tax=Bifidobacterium margollesii TaxID=2020964 RepID=A0A2N5JCQ4_9BIFI|nr:LysE family transporter [Bifidobacterium margollesii]PLS31981.1 Lysine exporter protein [Bifidobacterium margollesii]
MGFYLQGLTMGLAYIAPIGMQNLFVINSAMTKTRRRALMTAVIVLMFDVALSLSCFFGMGALIQQHEWLRLGVLVVGGAVVIRIGVGLLRTKPEADRESGSAETVAENASESQGTQDLRNRGLWDRSREHGRSPSRYADLRKTVSTACVVTWFNPQAIIDGTLLLGAFHATLPATQSTPFITGVETASALWFIGLTLVISAFSDRFSPKLLGVLNKVCGGVIATYGVKLLVDFAVAVL